jgi:hypothetical protein
MAAPLAWALTRRVLRAVNVTLGSLASRRDELAAAGRTAVFVAINGRAAGVIAMADAPRNNPLLLKRLHLSKPSTEPAAPAETRSRTPTPTG